MNPLARRSSSGARATMRARDRVKELRRLSVMVDPAVGLVHLLQRGAADPTDTSAPDEMAASVTDSETEVEAKNDMGTEADSLGILDVTPSDANEVATTTERASSSTETDELRATSLEAVAADENPFVLSNLCIRDAVEGRDKNGWYTLRNRPRAEHRVFWLQTNAWFSRGFLLCVLAHSVMILYESESFAAGVTVSVVAITYYTMDSLLKIRFMGLWNYITKRWNYVQVVFILLFA